MKKNALTLFAALLLFCPAVKAAMTDEQAGLAIKSFLNDPASETGINYAKQIMQFAEETPLYEVEIKRGYTPWLGASDAPRGSEILLAAYAAGNLQEQIKNRSSKSEPYAGVLAALDVYGKIRAINPDFRIVSVEQLVLLEKEGKLKAYIDSVKK